MAKLAPTPKALGEALCVDVELGVVAVLLVGVCHQAGVRVGEMSTARVVVAHDAVFQLFVDKAPIVDD